MNNLHKTEKNGSRLQRIEQMIDTRYTHIWDCCCDHGLLGFSLLNAQCAETVHFVDIVTNLMEQIEQKLKLHWQGARQDWQVHCLDAAELPIGQFSKAPETDKHLVIIAGVGGDLLIKLMRSLLHFCKKYHVEFILCPVHHNYKVRQFLIANQFSLINESLVFENHRGYEVLYVSRNRGSCLSVVGETMWELSNPLHVNYLQKKIFHYQRIANNPKMNISDIIEDYQRLLAVRN